MYLLDPVVMSELKKLPSGRASSAVFDWACRTSITDYFVSVITVLEIRQGILKLERRDPQQSAQLQAWVDEYMMPSFAGRILVFGLNEAQVCAELHVPDPRPERDAMIAATALVHGLTVVTRNMKDFAPMKVPVFNPWA